MATTYQTGYSDGDVDTNFTDLRTLNEIADERFSRRQTLLGGLTASMTAFLGTSLLTACGDDEVAFASETLVNAGQDAATSAGRMVTIAPTIGSATAFTVEQFSGPTVALTGTGATRSFFAPGVAAATNLGFRITANGQVDDVNITVNPAELGFAAVPRTLTDVVTVPTGHNVTVLTRLGDPILAGATAFANDGTDINFGARIGDHGDALYYYGLSAAGARDDFSSTRGLIVQNHENLNEQYLHINGPTNNAGVRPASEAIKEIEAHGVSVTEVQDTGNRTWVVVANSALNRRITPNTPMAINGPVRGTAFMQTVASPTGTTSTGTINNCGNGYSEWGTNLTCEENWAGYFRRDNSGAGTDNANRTARELTSLRRYGVNSTTGNNSWSTVSTTDPIFRRWDARAGTGAATTDYRNEPNTFGWVVEIDPFNPNNAPRKRTALGRMAHEGAWVGNLVEGQRLAVYMGCDGRREYMYKFVSTATWTNADRNRSDRLAVGDKYLDAGILYVARFNADGTGTWLPLVFGQVPDRPAVTTPVAAPAYTFESQADILVNARLAADAVGATPMDRPEWTAVNPANGEIYLTLTNNNAAGRPITGTDAANPRSYVEPVGAGSTAGNPNGHIVRMRETGNLSTATTFNWDIYLFGADSTDASANVNVSGLTTANDFSSPDGLWFARPQNPSGIGRPLLWVQTDDGAFTDRTNNQMLAALPGRVGDGGARTITNTNGTTATQATFVGAAATGASLRRFLVGPREAEITGVDTTPDGRTLFVGIQHPGENGTPAAPSSNWPQSQSGTASGRPRSGVVAVTRADGGIVGI